MDRRLAQHYREDRALRAESAIMRAWLGTDDVAVSDGLAPSERSFVSVREDVARGGTLLRGRVIA